jgi:hypothetical protein
MVTTKIQTMENKTEQEDNFGEFGEIAVRNCFICNKTVLQKNCYGFIRDKDTPKFVQNSTSGYTVTTPKSYMCLKCLLKGLYNICPDKKQINEYLDLYTKVAITEELNKNTNQKV